MVSTVSCFSLGVVFFLVVFLPPAFFPLPSLPDFPPNLNCFHLFLFFLPACVALFPNQPTLCIFPLRDCWIVCSPYCIFACVFSNLYFQLSPIPSSNWNILQPACNALSISVSPLKSLLFHSLPVRLLGGLHMDLLSRLLFTALSNKGKMPLPTPKNLNIVSIKTGSNVSFETSPESCPCMRCNEGCKQVSSPQCCYPFFCLLTYFIYPQIPSQRCAALHVYVDIQNRFNTNKII